MQLRPWLQSPLHLLAFGIVAIITTIATITAIVTKIEVIMYAPCELIDLPYLSQILVLQFYL